MIKFLNNKINIFGLLIVILIMLSGCANNTKNVNKLNLEKYGITDSELAILEITYDELIQNDENNTIDGLVLVVKTGCGYCPPFIERINNIYEDGETLKNMYALESDKMSTEQKMYLTDKYMLTSVPTIMVFENGNFKSIEVGNIDDETLKQIITK